MGAAGFEPEGEAWKAERSLACEVGRRCGLLLDAAVSQSGCDLRWPARAVSCVPLTPDAATPTESPEDWRLKGTVWTAGCQSWYRTESGRS